MVTSYSPWMGKSVVMNIVSGTSRVALCCRVVHESDELVRVHISDQWDVDIYRDMIESVKLDAGAQTRVAMLFEA